MNKIVFTICSANHLAQARCLGDSLKQYAPGYTLVIGLVDRIDGRFTRQDVEYEVIEAEEIGLSSFSDMAARYSIIELNCAMKPFFCLHILDRYKLSRIVYLDSDIYLFGNLNLAEEALDTHDIIITPHFTTPFNDDKIPLERDVLKSGLYNGGFFAINNNEKGLAFINWWKERLIDQCYYNFCEGMGVDQAWLDFVPLYFEKVMVLQNKGYNVAYWNLHERSVSGKNGAYRVNDTEPLIFFHISGYDVNQPGQLSKHQNRYIFDTLPVVKEIYEEYRSALQQNRHSFFSQLACVYVKPKKKRSILVRLLSAAVQQLGYKIVKS